MIDGHCTRNNRTGANSLEYPESDHVLHKNHASTEARKISQPIDSLMEKFIHSLVTAQGANRPFRCACGLDGLRGAPPRRGKANRADLKNHCDASQRAIQISNEETGFRGDDRCRIASRSGSAPGKISQPVAEGQHPECDGGVVSGVDHSEGFQPLASTHRRPAGFSPAVNSEIQATGRHRKHCRFPARRRRSAGRSSDLFNSFPRRRLDPPCHAPPQSARAGRGQAGGTLIRSYSFSSSSLATRRKPSR